MWTTWPKFSAAHVFHSFFPLFVQRILWFLPWHFFFSGIFNRHRHHVHVLFMGSQSFCLLVSQTMKRVQWAPSELRNIRPLRSPRSTQGLSVVPWYPVESGWWPFAFGLLVQLQHCFWWVPNNLGILRILLLVSLWQLNTQEMILMLCEKFCAGFCFIT